uniref:Disease resistance RPP13-like protein 1 n=1 Tax=Cajanus cajan TaxID=3821 RepID=A0A151T0A2_CAJCA|nr:Putative disease resistance RPP13-like protein 1 [Cajanus cajan]
MAFAMVGEALISASVEILLDRITSSEFRDYFANRKLNVSLLDELKIKLLSLNAVLNDAEEKQITDLAVRAWLDELKDAVLDAEDLLDEINTDSLRSKVEGESKTLTTRVRSLLSSPFNQFYSSINSKLEAISTRLEHFVKHKDILGLQSVSRRVSSRTVTDSLVESVVVAREDDKEKLLRMLLSDEDGKNNHIEVLTILGMGGLGKTTLAQCLYNNNAVQKHFDLTTWAWVSDDFDVFRVTKTIVESVTSKKSDSSNLDALRVELKNNLTDKKFLLVLDDLWNEGLFQNGKNTFNIVRPVLQAVQAVLLAARAVLLAARAFLLAIQVILLAARAAMKLYDVSKRFEGLYELKFVRTFLPQSPYVYYHYLTKRVSHGWLPKLRCLRTLSLSTYRNITELPDSIGNLVLLRYLDLSSTSIKRLPDATFTLYNLQTLKLANCKFLMQLSGQIANLVNLRHLDIRDTNLNEIPKQICKLQDLRTLTSFVVGREDGLRIKELGKFLFLQGNLSILKLQNVVNPMDAFQANMKKKKQIEELTLKWGEDPQDSQIEKDVFENLQPSTNLKKLTIRYYSGTSFPKWLSESSYSNVIVLRISDCNYCLSLPPFGQLPSLKELVIQRMEMVKTVDEEFYSNNERSSLFQPFPMLESLQFEEMLEWEEWLPFKGENSEFPFPLLKHLSLSECPKLRGNLPNHLPSLKEVSISNCHSLTSITLDCFPALERLSIISCPNLEAITTQGGGPAPKLINFKVRDCEKLRSLPELIDLPSLKYSSLSKLAVVASFGARFFPSSLQSLTVNVGMLSCMSKDELGFIFPRLTSLSHLRIEGGGEADVVNIMLKEPLLPTSLQGLYLQWLDGLKCLGMEGKGLQHLTSLQSLSLWGLDELKSWEGNGLQHLTSLRYLEIGYCGSLESLPEDHLPSSFEFLTIRNCPLLEERYQNQKGKYWSKIAHIPSISIKDEVII